MAEANNNGRHFKVKVVIQNTFKAPRKFCSLHFGSLFNEYALFYNLLANPQEVWFSLFANGQI